MPTRTLVLPAVSRGLRRRPQTLGDLVATLVAQHREIEQRLSRLSSLCGTDSFEREVAGLNAAVSHHTALELDAFYPLAHFLLETEEEVLVTTAVVEHEPLLGLMEILGRSTGDDPLTVPRIGLLIRHMRQHFADEEMVLFHALESRGHFAHRLRSRIADEALPTGAATPPRGRLH